METYNDQLYGDDLFFKADVLKFKKRITKA